MKLFEILINLPASLIHESFDSFLQLKDIVRVDSAACSSTDRACILNTLYEANAICISELVILKYGSDIFVDWLTKRNVNVSALSISIPNNFNTIKWKPYLQKHGKHISNISFCQDILGTLVDMNSLDGLKLHDLCEYCPNVHTLLIPKHFTEVDYDTVLNCWAHSVRAINCTMNCSNLLMLVGKKCQQLEQITIRVWTQSVHFALPEFFRVCSPAITHINLSTWCTDEILHELAAHCPGLMQITFARHLRHYSDDGIIALAKGCPALQMFNFQDNHRITDVGLSALARNGSLTSISLYEMGNITDASITTLSRCCHNLQTLTINSCSHFSDSALAILGTELRKLKKVALTRLPITDQGIISLVTGNVGISEFCIWSVSAVTDTGIIAIAEHCPTLEILSLFRLGTITDASINALAQCCFKLKVLHIPNCDLSDTAMTGLVRNCYKITNLNVSSCPHLSDSLLISIATHCRYITELNVSETRVTVEGLNYLMNLCGVCAFAGHIY